jgi:cytochrome b561
MIKALSQPLTSASQRWPVAIQALHWLLAVLILFMLGLGLYMVEIEQDPGHRFELYQWHKTLGAWVFLLTALRAALRIGTVTPPYPDTMPEWQRRAGKGAHLLIYALTFAMGVTGYIMISSSPLPLPIDFAGGVQVPNLIAPDYGLSEQMKAIHHRLAWTFLALLALHILAALKHHFWDRDQVLWQMLPF